MVKIFILPHFPPLALTSSGSKGYAFALSAMRAPLGESFLKLYYRDSIAHYEAKINSEWWEIKI